MKGLTTQLKIFEHETPILDVQDLDQFTKSRNLIKLLKECRARCTKKNISKLIKIVPLLSFFCLLENV